MSDAQHLERIQSAISTRNIDELRQLSRKGFINNEMRRKVWPLLLGCDDDAHDAESKTNNDQQQVNQKHSYYDQIKKDTIRSMHHFDVTKSYTLTERQHQQQALERILNGIFGKSENIGNLHYTQGFHDLCSVFYIVCGEDLGQRLSENLAKRHMRDLVRENMNVYQFILKLLFPLLSLCDAQLYEQCFSDQDIQSMFALSWLITWFAHNIENFDDITRLYDFFLSTHPLMPLYFSVSLIIHGCKEQLLHIKRTAEYGLDQGRLHQFFQEYDWNINYDQIIMEADRIFERYPPHDLYRQFFIDELSKNVPKDSPFLARNVAEIENMKNKYSLHSLTFSWNPQNPKFWKFVVFGTSMAVIAVAMYNQNYTGGN